MTCYVQALLSLGNRGPRALLVIFENIDFLELQEKETLSCTRFLAFQDGENSCAGARDIDIQLDKRPKSVG